MYRIGHQIKHHYRLYIIIGVVLLGLIVVGVMIALQDLQSNTVLNQSKAHSQYYSANNPSTQTIKEHDFSFTLPSNWHSATNVNPVGEVYSWQGTGDDSTRRIDVYIDRLPQGMAFNRLLPVEINGDQLEVIGSVSDNCTTFTTPTAQSAQNGTIAAKWDGVNFLCDTANYERDVVGIGAATNPITLTGLTSGAHNVLLVYTDNNYTPDYSFFTSIVESFHLL
jgi:hypothetical protein